MITQFFPRQMDGAGEDVVKELSKDLCVVASPRGERVLSPTPPATESSHNELVEQVVSAVMSHVGKRKRSKALVTESGLHTFVQNVLEERTPLHVQHAPNPISPPASTMPQLLHRFFNTDQVSTWQSFYTSTKSCFAPLVDAIVSRRQQQQVDSFFAGDGGEGGKKKRPAAPVELVPSTAVVLHDTAQPQPLDEWEMAHVLMRDQVLAIQQRSHSPPASPTRKGVRRVTKLTESEQLQCSVLRASRYHACATDNDRITMLFRAFNADTTLPPANYDPPFDRNDLFFTNVTAARNLFRMEHTFCQEARRRKAAGESLADLQCPAVHIVAVQYTGPLVAADMATCVYVTWALASELKPSSPLSETPTFLDDVLSGRVRLNNMFTELVDRVARYSTGEDLWKRRFSVAVLDSSGGAVCEANLPALVALVDTYAEQYGGVGKGRGADGKPLLGLNFVQHHHARHRLIFECGSVQTYRVVWQCNKNKDVYEAAHGKAVKVAGVAVATARLMWQKLVALLAHVHEESVSHGERASAPVSELHSLAKLFLETAQQFEDAAREAHRAMCTYERSTEERKEKVKRSYAAASVQESMDGCPVQSSIVSLFQSIQANPLGDVPPLHTLHTHATQVHQAKTLLMHSWFFICTPVPDVPWKKVFAEHDEAAAVRSAQVLEALTLLELWRPADWVEGGSLPPVPPRHLDNSMITANFRSTIRGTHTDKHVRDIHEGRTSHSSQHELTQRVLQARQLLTQFMVDITVEVTMASVT